MSSWDDLKGNLNGWFDTAAHRTDKLARLGVRAYDRYGIHRDLDRHFGNLGALVHRILSEDPLALLGEDAAVRAEMGKIARLQDELSQTQSEMDGLRENLKDRPKSPTEEPAEPQDADFGDPDAHEEDATSGQDTPRPSN